MALFAPTQDAQLPSFGANDYLESTEYPVAQPEAAAHGVAIHAVWDPVLGAHLLPTLVFRYPSTVSVTRLIANTNSLRLWRPPIPFQSSLSDRL